MLWYGPNVEWFVFKVMRTSVLPLVFDYKPSFIVNLWITGAPYDSHHLNLGFAFIGAAVLGFPTLLVKRLKGFR